MSLTQSTYWALGRWPFEKAAKSVAGSRILMPGALVSISFCSSSTVISGETVDSDLSDWIAGVSAGA